MPGDLKTKNNPITPNIGPSIHSSNHENPPSTLDTIESTTSQSFNLLDPCNKTSSLRNATSSSKLISQMPIKLNNVKSTVSSFFCCVTDEINPPNNIQSSKKNDRTFISKDDDFEGFVDVHITDETGEKYEDNTSVGKSDGIKILRAGKSLVKALTFRGTALFALRNTSSFREYVQADENNCGIVQSHLNSFQNICKELGIFGLFRLTELASTLLLKLGNAAKSMDVHEKSANAGLAKGFIPADQAFSKIGLIKKLIPKINFLPKFFHGKAKAIPLYMETKLLDLYAIDLNEYVFNETTQIFCNKQSDSFTPTDQTVRYFTTNPNDNCPKNILYIAKKSESEDEWTITWTFLSDAEKNIPLKADVSAPCTPLYVFAYEIEGKWKPMTADYDMWATIPNHSLLSLDGSHQKILDDHGKSIISAFCQKVVKLFNTACGRANNPVVRHGAEMQNIDFAQPLDDALVCMTPSGQAIIITKEHFAKTLFDLVTRGYLIKWNPAYENDELPLGGKFFGVFEKDDLSEETLHARGVLKKHIQELRDLYKQKYTAELNDLPLPENLETEISEIDIKLEEYLSSKTSLQLKDIIRFHSELDCLLTFATTDNPSIKKLKYLAPEHFPNSIKFIKSPTERAKLISIVREMVKNTDIPEYEPRSLGQIDNNYQVQPSPKFSDDQGLKDMEQRMALATQDITGPLQLSREEAAKKNSLDLQLLNQYLSSFN